MMVQEFHPDLPSVEPSADQAFDQVGEFPCEGGGQQTRLSGGQARDLQGQADLPAAEVVALAEVLAETGWSQTQAAAAFVRVALESGARDLAGVSRSQRFGVAPDGPVFRNQAGNYVEAAAYGMTWARARKYVLTRTELASGLAKRPYDLRHAGISFWLYSGVDPAECARRAGQSIEVLFRHYAKFLDGVREQANRLIEQSMEEWDRVSRAGAPAG
ncbi:hypothetical protein [Streptomyces sp. NBC_00212]|uniref:hypothetical protein n=1 Tax=Streptomyces sp. NBC_00212 TaxID=2975684 RepID=UPI00386B9707